ncbi:MAG: hypothetical protein ACHP9T_08470 [Caulobacterales bacterium]
MRAFSTPLLAALLLAAAASSAAAAVAPKHAPAPTTGGVESDLRCLLTMAVIGQDKTKQPAAQMGAAFFTGRISARAPGIDLPSAVKAEEAKLAPKDLPAEAQRCGPMVQNAMRSLQASFSPPAGAQRPAGPAAAPAPGAAPVPPPK